MTRSTDAALTVRLARPASSGASRGLPGLCTDLVCRVDLTTADEPWQRALHGVRSHERPTVGAEAAAVAGWAGSPGPPTSSRGDRRSGCTPWTMPRPYLTCAGDRPRLPRSRASGSMGRRDDLPASGRPIGRDVLDPGRSRVCMRAPRRDGSAPVSVRRPHRRPSGASASRPGRLEQRPLLARCTRVDALAAMRTRDADSGLAVGPLDAARADAGRRSARTDVCADRSGDDRRRNRWGHVRAAIGRATGGACPSTTSSAS